jgi:hypothetical protein
VFRERLFFELAAVLIPTLLFGGAVSNAFKPRELFRGLSTSRRWLVVAGLTGAVLAALLGEMFAIELALSDNPSTWRALYVIYIVVFSSAAMGAAFLWPWVTDAIRQPWGRLALVFVVSAFVLTGTSLLANSVFDAMVLTERQRIACFNRYSDEIFAESERRAIEAENLLTQFVEVGTRDDISSRQRRHLERVLTIRIKAALDRYLRTSGETYRSFRQQDAALAC